MRKFLQVEQFPTSELVVPRGELKWQGGAATVQGTLKLHGKSKPIAISYEASRSGHEVKVRTKSAFKLTDFGFEPPALGPAKVSDVVELAVDATLNDE